MNRIFGYNTDSIYDLADENATTITTTPTERLLNIFKADEFGKISPELNLIMQVGCMSMFVGGIYGGFMETRYTYADFVKNNQATIFQDHLAAKKKLQDKFTSTFGRGAFKWSWRLTYFSTTYIGISTCISTYRGKSGILDHSVAGTVTGLTYKFTMGPRGWIVGAGLGLVLGTIAGCVTAGMLKLTGITMEDVRKTQYQVYTGRDDSEKQAMTTYMLKEQLEILTDHDNKIGDAGKTLDPVNIEKPK